MNHTVVEMKTAPNSLINAYTMAKIIQVWDVVAEKVEKLVTLSSDEVIIWRLVYNFHKATFEEEEDSEMVNGGFQPLITGQVSVIDKDTLFLRKSCPYALEFNFGGAVAYGVPSNRLMVFGEDDVIRRITESFKG